MRYLNPKADLTFKRVFGEHPDLVMSLLNALLPLTPHTYSEKKMHALWLRYLTEIDDNTREVAQELLDNAEVKKAVTALEESAFTDAQLAGYEKFWDIISVERTLCSSYERKGRAEGMAEGIERGIEQGIERGIEQGKSAEQRLIAANLKRQGIALETIAQCTGLSLEEIAAL